MAGGACIHNPNQLRSVVLYARRRGEDPLDTAIDFIWDAKESTTPIRPGADATTPPF